MSPKNLPQVPQYAQAQSLLASQFPQWSDLPLRSLNSPGTSNTLFRLGDRYVLRFPRSENAAQAIKKEQHWLSQLAPHLSIKIPEPIGLGQAQPDFAWPWSICEWLPGQDLWQAAFTPSDMAQALGHFVNEMRALPLEQGPAPGAHNSWRGVPLKQRHEQVLAAIQELGTRIDQTAVLKCWEKSLEAPLWQQAHWIHGDLIAGNLLAHHQKLTAVIDFGLLGVGDPAVDLIPAWNLLDETSRQSFREIVQADEACWLRGQGWALSQALIALPYYWDSNPQMVQMGQQVLKSLKLSLKGKT